jgi:hypothetical protein
MAEHAGFRIADVIGESRVSLWFAATIVEKAVE